MPVINGPMPVVHIWRYRVLFTGGIFVVVLGTMLGSRKLICIGIGMVGLYALIGDEDIDFSKIKKKRGVGE